jgi:putative tryptophan/tyrosine transport system substrate-binding protein
MHNNRTFSIPALVVLVLGALGSPYTHAQHTEKVWKVGILWHAANLQEEQVMFKPFAEGMRELGYIEGKNVIFEHTFVGEKYELFASSAQYLVDRKVDIILASIPMAAVAAARVTKEIPIVFPSGGDPVRLGLVESLRHPGRNLTGLSLFYPELAAKDLELLHDLVPGLSRMAVLGNPANEDYRAALDGAERAAQTLGLEVVKFGAESPEQFAETFAEITKAGVGGMIVLGDSMLRVNRKPIVEFAADAKLPTVYGPRDYVDAGGLVSYGVCIPCNFRYSAVYVDKIIKGAKPSDLPVEQPSKFEMVINLRTAKKLGINVATATILRADEVIE